MTTVWETQIPVRQAYVNVDQVKNAIETRIPAQRGCVDVEIMMNAPEPSFAFLVNAEACY